MAEHTRLTPDEVHEVLASHLLTDPSALVADLERSRGSRIVDARTGTRYLDLYTFFASSPLGFNHPGLTDDPSFLAELGQVALHKPANPDVYTTAYADFVATFARVLGDPALPHLFFVEGGALAVENALKVAFDWKSRQNEAAGRSRDLGTKIMHFTKAFHGRSGYTLSLTNTEPNKTDRFPKFDWPRIEVPAVRFPLERHLREVEEAEARALEQAERAFAAHPHDIAAFIAEPVQGEGGDNHVRPEFFARMKELVHAHDALMIFDEVQTGVGTTGSAWAYQQLGVTPDVVAFAKKAQVGGVMAGGRVDEVEQNVFVVQGRINSTWGGGLVDMVRSRKLLEIIESEDLFSHAGAMGEHLLAGLQRVEAGSEVVDNARGRGLFAAVDLVDRTTRDSVIVDLFEHEHVIALACGERSIRFRPALVVTAEEIDEAVGALGRSVARVASA
jgi:L-lysine 6-transaminase